MLLSNTKFIRIEAQMTKTCEQLFAGIANTILGNAQVKFQALHIEVIKCARGTRFFA
jgi:hypothetical protein